MVIKRRDAGVMIDVANVRRSVGGIMQPVTDGFRREGGLWVRVWPDALPPSTLEIVRVTPPSRVFINSGIGNGQILPNTGGTLLANDVVLAFIYTETSGAANLPVFFASYGNFGTEPNTTYGQANPSASSENIQNFSRFVSFQPIRRFVGGPDLTANERQVEWNIDRPVTLVVQLVVLRGVINTGNAAFNLSSDAGSGFSSNNSATIASGDLAFTGTQAGIPTPGLVTVSRPSTVFSWGNTNDGVLSAVPPANWSNVGPGTWNSLAGFGNNARQTFLEFRNIIAPGPNLVAVRSSVPPTNCRIVVCPIAAP